MRLLSIALSCLFAVTLSAQEPSITYPYNPDSNTDSLIGASDLVDFLPFYGEEFTPEPLTIEGMSLEEWMEQQTSSSGGGCDWKFPEGLDGETVVHDFTQGEYMVPENKNLYITSLYTNDEMQVEINNIVITSAPFNRIEQTSPNSNTTGGVLNNPLILNQFDIINFLGDYGSFTGILAEKSNNVTPFTLNLNSTPYTVPAGKKMVILNLRHINAGQEFQINGTGVLSTYYNSSSGFTGFSVLSSPYILESNSELSSTAFTQINGYLVDEDYFADCGGGGGVDISGLQEQIDAVAADSYAADAALITASDNADDELQAQIDEAVSNLQEQLDSALASNENLQEQLEEMHHDLNHLVLQQLQIGESFSINFTLGSSYTVPEGKRLICYQRYDDGCPEYTIIDNQGNNLIIPHGSVIPNMMFGSGYSITLTNCFDQFGCSSECEELWMCQLVDQEENIQPITISFTADNLSYTVPDGKALKVNDCQDLDPSANIGTYNYIGYTGPNAPNSFLFEEGQIITYTPNPSYPLTTLYMFGYLIDTY